MSGSYSVSIAKLYVFFMFNESLLVLSHIVSVFNSMFKSFSIFSKFSPYTKKFVSSANIIGNVI